MIISEVIPKPFHNYVITFSSTPTFVEIRDDGSAFNRWKQISNISWSGTTDFQKTFEIILNRARMFGLTKSDMPRRLIIISDQQFDGKINFEEINIKYREAGYNKPQIVFWNVNGSSTDFPVMSDTVFIGGSSPSTLHAIIHGKDFTPEGIMCKTLNNQRYDMIREAFKNQEPI